MSKTSYYGGSTLVNLGVGRFERESAGKCSPMKAGQNALREQDRLIAASAQKAAEYQRQLKRAKREEEMLKRRAAAKGKAIV